MSGAYPPENVPFSTESCMSAFLVLRGPGEAAVTSGIDVLTRVRDDLRFAADALKGAASTLTAVHEGAAADAAHRHLRTIEDSALSGVSEADRAVDALRDQGNYVRVVRNEVAAIAGPPVPPTLATASAPPAGGPAAAAAYEASLAEANRLADEAGERYRGNANLSFGAQLPPFETPPARAAGASGGSAGAGGGGIAVGPAGAISPAGDPMAVGPAGGIGGGPSGGAGGGPGATPPASLAAAPPATGPGLGATPLPTPPIVPGAVAGGAVPGAAGRSAVPPATVLPPRDGDYRSGSLPVPARPPVPGPGAGRSGPLTGWTPGQPWTGRPGGDTASTRSPDGVPLPRGASTEHTPTRTAGTPGSPASPGTAATTSRGFGHVPLLPFGATGGQDGDHRRPPWLLQDDADAIWFAGVPHHVDPVIRGEPAGRSGN